MSLVHQYLEVNGYCGYTVRDTEQPEPPEAKLFFTKQDAIREMAESMLGVEKIKEIQVKAISKSGREINVNIDRYEEIAQTLIEKAEGQINNQNAVNLQMEALINLEPYRKDLTQFCETFLSEINEKSDKNAELRSGIKYTTDSKEFFVVRDSRGIVMAFCKQLNDNVDFGIEIDI